MAVSKRTRFEVLRRDSHTCRYCGQSAPDVKLTVDHVVPTALGGADIPANLVAACKDCNAGKSSTVPDDRMVAQVDDDAMRWAAARARAAERLAEAESERHRTLAPFLSAWREWDELCAYLPSDWEESLSRWISAGIPVSRIIQALTITTPKRHIKHPDVFRYISGIVYNWIAELDALTVVELARDEG